MTDRGFDTASLVDAALVMWRADVNSQPFSPALDSAALLREWRRQEAIQDLLAPAIRRIGPDIDDVGLQTGHADTQPPRQANVTGET